MMNRLAAAIAVGALIAVQPVCAAPATLAEALDLWGSVLTRFVDEQGRTDSTPSRRTAAPSTKISRPTASARA
jgi:hypothetical protein